MCVIATINDAFHPTSVIYKYILQKRNLYRIVADDRHFLICFSDIFRIQSIREYIYFINMNVHGINKNQL